jgi:hypothetical protein
MQLNLVVAGLALLAYNLQAQVSFAPAVAYAVGKNPHSVTTADVNGDGKLDLICANSGTNTLSVLTNDGNGGFLLASMLVVGNGPQWVVATDVNRDGALDLICANWGANTTTLVVLINDGTGNFGPPAIYPLSDAPNAVAAADLNGDGNIELVSSLWDIRGF